MSSFKYDIVTLIELVESKPCIWDKTNENNKNKKLRDKSWQEIFKFLEDGYEQLSQAEKKKTAGIVMAKWSNIRDSFLRSLRTKSGQGAKRCYIYSEHLKFLLNIAQKDETDSNYSQAAIEDENIEVEELTDSQLPTGFPRNQPKPESKAQPIPSTSRSRTSSEYRLKSKRHLDDIKREILFELKHGEQAVELCSKHPRSDQEMLLLSFIPYIRDMSEKELMDFQMGVLTTIKQIKAQRVSKLQTAQQQNVPPAQQHYDKVPLPSPMMSQSESNQSFDNQATPPSNQIEQQQGQSSQKLLTIYKDEHNYQELFEEYEG